MMKVLSSMGGGFPRRRIIALRQRGAGELIKHSGFAIRALPFGLCHSGFAGSRLTRLNMKAAGVTSRIMISYKGLACGNHHQS